jgi:AcrR family transcriptional regulator
VIRAAIQCISGEGFQRATATRISELSGVSWGGIQHQFGDKSAILDAVLEQVLGDFQRQLASFSTEATSLAGRVKALVDASWNLICDPTYRAFREILRNHPIAGAETLAPERFMGQVTSTLEDIAASLFAELSLKKSTVDLVNSVLFSSLSGIAEQSLFKSYPESLARIQLVVLRETLLRLIREDGGSPS